MSTEFYAKRTMRSVTMLAAASALVLVAVPTPARAQTGSSTTSRGRGGAAAAKDTIKITGTKKARGQLAEDAPVAVSAFGDEQIDALQFRDMESLTFSVPNASFDAVGTLKGVANFSIRGLGANSSIPTIDPTVGLFVNGVYYGSNAGAVLDSFDLEAIEVLRGPQGILFGRNVTGGAVLLRTKRPGDTYSASAKFNVEAPFIGESGFEYRGYGAVDLPLVEDLLKVRISGQYRSDEGWFTNQQPVANPTNPLAPETTNERFGFEDTWLIRPTVSFTPADAFTLHVTYEHGETDGAGPAAQSASRTSDLEGAPAGPFNDFDFSIDEPGSVRWLWNQVFAEAILDLGDAGQLTDIFGFRVVNGRGVSDIDASPLFQFHAGTLTNITHWSNELRYTNSFADNFLDVTAGLYVFSQTIEYREQRDLLFGQVTQAFGGDQDQISLGAFSQLEFNVTDDLKLIGGARVTWEEKSADVAVPGPTNGGNPCGTRFGDCTFDFNDTEDWLNVSPKVGVQWNFMDDNQVYGHWQQGFRSGGYNMRNTSPDPAAVPGPFNEEQQNAFELGWKGALLDRRLRFTLAGFVTLMDDLQREVNLPAAGTGVVQIIRNTADAVIYGGELEATIIPINSLVINGSLGLTDAEYTEVRFDLNQDGMVDSADEDLTLPRLANVTANIGGLYDIDLGDAGIITLRANYAYRDSSFFTDNNLGALPSGHVVDASIAYAFADVDLGSTALYPKLTLYGRNLANEAFLGGQTPLPPALAPMAPPLGGNFSPLKEGRVFGLELRMDWE